MEMDALLKRPMSNGDFVPCNCVTAIALSKVETVCLFASTYILLDS